MGTPEQIKEAIRREMQVKRRHHTGAKRLEAGRAISEKLAGPPLNLFAKVKWVSIYLSGRDEIPTRYIARMLWQWGRRVCVPTWSQTLKAYRLCEITPATRLISGPLGIKQPAERHPVRTQDVDAFIIPGLAFDPRGGRVGYGKGYYDRILAGARADALKIGVCYSWQLLHSELPLEKHDVAMDWVATNGRMVKCAP